MAELVHVIDDDPGLRKSLTFLLAVNGFEVRDYGSATAFLEAMPVPDGCILTDMRMPGMTGLELVRRLKSDQCDLPVIVMTGHGDVELAVAAMKAGVVDFIEKPFSDATVLQALRDAQANRGAPISAESARAAALQRLDGLSPREREVLVGVAAGKLNKMIAYELEISPRTVEIYRANMMAKTGSRNLAELMRLALAAGL